MPSPRREHLVDTAMKLFAQEGFHATGIDRILEEAGVAKMTLYNHFRSKDELILAALRRWDEITRNTLMKAVEAAATDPVDRLIALFDIIEHVCSGKNYQGCFAVHAAAEFGGPSNPIHKAAAEHNHLLTVYVQDLAAQAGAKDPQALAEQLIVLKNGAMVMAHIMGNPIGAAQAKQAANSLIQIAMAVKA